MRPLTTLPVLLLLTLALFSTYRVAPVRASSPTNIILNPSFENGIDSKGVPVNWDFSTCEGVGNATATLDSTTAVDGNHSARVYSGPITNTFCVPTPPNSTRNVGFTQFRQFLMNPVNFTDLTDSPDGFSFWFKLQPYNTQSGMGGFDIRVFGAESTAELDYAFNPDPSFSFVNNTGVGSFLFHGYQPGQWYHFSRNLRADWLSLGLPLNHPFSLVMFEGLVLQSGPTVKSETFWLDDVRASTGNLLPHVTISRGSPAVIGQPVTFTAVASGGTLPYAYQWSADQAQVNGATQSTFTAYFSALGPHSVSVNVTDANTASTNQTLNFNVEPPLVINVTCNPNPGTTLKPVTCNASVSGGAPPFTFSWAINGYPATGTGASYTTYFFSKGTQTVTATVTDSNNVKKTGTVIETIAPQPVIVTPTCGSATVDMPVTCIVTATGGTPPYTFSWSAPGGSPPTGTGTSFTTTYIASGTNFVNVTAIDANNAKSSATATITVSARSPTVTISSLTPNPANTGDPVTVKFAVNSTSVLTGITISWGDGTVTHPSPTATSDTHVYLSTGSVRSQRFTANVTVTNSGGQGSSIMDEIVNDRPPTVAITSVSPSPASTGQPVELNFTATDPDGTISAVRVAWGDGSQPDLILTISSLTLSGGPAMLAYATHTYSNTGNSQTQTFTILVNATDNGGSAASRTVNEVIKDLSPSVASINVSPNPVATGARVTVVFSASDPDGTVSSISINWGDRTVDSLGGTSSSDTHTYASTGSFDISIIATDNVGSTSQAATLTVIVNVPSSSAADQNPTILGVSLAIFYIGVGGIAAAITILGALTILRKRKAKE